MSRMISHCSQDLRSRGLLVDIQTVGGQARGDPGGSGILEGQKVEGRLAEVTRMSLLASRICLGLRPQQKGQYSNAAPGKPSPELASWVCAKSC